LRIKTQNSSHVVAFAYSSIRQAEGCHSQASPVARLHGQVLGYVEARDRAAAELAAVAEFNLSPGETAGVPVRRSATWVTRPRVPRPFVLQRGNNELTCAPSFTIGKMPAVIFVCVEITWSENLAPPLRRAGLCLF
jgi:hypothetical protein